MKMDSDIFPDMKGAPGLAVINNDIEEVLKDTTEIEGIQFLARRGVCTRRRLVKNRICLHRILKIKSDVKSLHKHFAEADRISASTVALEQANHAFEGAIPAILSELEGALGDYRRLWHPKRTCQISENNMAIMMIPNSWVSGNPIEFTDRGTSVCHSSQNVYDLVGSDFPTVPLPGW